MFIKEKIIPITVIEKLKSYEGYLFQLQDKDWKISKRRSLKIDLVTQWVEKEIAESFVKVLSYYAEKYSSAHTFNQFWNFQQFVMQQYAIKKKPLSLISSELLIGYRSTLDREHEYYLGVLKGFLKTWIEFDYPGIDKSVGSLLDGWRLRGNIKGRAVQTLCPKKGPLSDFEFEALHQSLVDNFEINKICISDFALVQLFMITGRKPAQLADLKVKDFVKVESQNGLREYLLNVPRRKQRGLGWRKQFKPFALLAGIGVLLENFMQESKLRLHEFLKVDQLSSFEEFPLFPDWDAIQMFVKTKKVEDIIDFLKSDQFHCCPTKLSCLVNSIVFEQDIISERTGEPLKIFPTRLRRTLATRAAREGFGELVIAELLDHTDTQNARVYTENVPEHVERLIRPWLSS